VGFHELDEDFVLALELGFELLDLSLLRLADHLSRGPFAGVLERQVAMLEELFEPIVNLIGIKLVLIAEI
jgi:hypothetical protein